jgi:hypothetical protein
VQFPSMWMIMRVWVAISIAVLLSSLACRLGLAGGPGLWHPLSTPTVKL